MLTATKEYRTVRSPSPPTTAATFDTAWFKGKISDLKLKQTTLARLFPMDPAGLSKLLHGTRKMQIHEASVIAKAFGVSLEEVVERAGIDVPLGKEDRVPVVGWIDPWGIVHTRQLKGPKVVPRPPGASASTKAYRVQGGSQDGWIMYVEDVEGNASLCDGKYCLVRMREVEGEHLRYVKKGYGPGTVYTMKTPSGKEEEGGMISGRPVLWIKCA